MQVLFDLLAQGCDHARRTVADIEAADTAGEIEVTIAIDVFERRAFGGCHEDGSTVVRTARNGGFASRHQRPRTGPGNFGANLNRSHFSTTRSEFRRG